MGYAKFSPLAILALSAVCSFPAQAKRMSIDFNYPNLNNANGEAWPFSTTGCVPLSSSTPVAAVCPQDFTAPNAFAVAPIGFGVNIGGTTYQQLFVDRNGTVTFVAALGALQSPADFDALTTVIGTGNPFIAAFYPKTALSLPKAVQPTDIFNGGAEYGRGSARPDGQPAPDGSGGFDVNDVSGNTLAFKATWVEGCTSPDVNSGTCLVPLPVNPLSTRIVIYKRHGAGDPIAADAANADGDFDVRIEYGQDDATTYNAGSGRNGLAGFRLGSDADKKVISGSFAAPTVIRATTDYYYQFRGGHLVGAVTAQVTVPNVLGQPQSVATTLIDAVTGLTVGTVTLQASSAVSAGSVISESPAAGTKVTPPAKVNLVVSSGAMKGDINGDGQVDKLDVALVMAALNKPAAANDPRDLDHNGIINVVDARAVTLLCTHAGCATN
jgi:PASTA domain/Dockerin type I domain